MALILNKSCLSNFYSFNLKNQAIDKKMTVENDSLLSPVQKLKTFFDLLHQ